MASKLRRKTIFIAMISVTLVLVFIVGTINLVNHLRMTNNADNLITAIIENGGSLDPTQPVSADGYNNETPFDTRYFTAVKNTDGTYTYDLEHVTLNETEASLLLNEAISRGSGKGYIDDYRFGQAFNNDETLYVFVNCYKSIASANNFMAVSTLVSVISLMFVFILVYIFSGMMIQPLVESYNKQKSFITNASHEMKTPLTIISANNEIIELEHGKSESTEAISRQVRRLNTMVKDMTTLAKLDEKETLDQTKTTDISEILEGICEDFKPAFENDNIEFILNIEDHISYVCDASLIRKLFLMLIDNAYKYCKTFTNISLLVDNKNIVFEISNDAENIKPGNLNYLFERFKRTEEARASNIEGSGIGLSVAYEIVKLHKGEITATGYENSVFAIKVKL